LDDKVFDGWKRECYLFVGKTSLTFFDGDFLRGEKRWIALEFEN